jgi:hypothetical protein
MIVGRSRGTRNLSFTITAMLFAMLFVAPASGETIDNRFDEVNMKCNRVD